MRREDKIAELNEAGFCVLKGRFPKDVIRSCREAFWPVLVDHIERNRDRPNRGVHRNFLPMPFEPPCFAPEFFFDAEVLRIARNLMDERIVADQWGCDAPLRGSTHQEFHVDYRHPLFPETPDLSLPVYMLVVSFSLMDIGPAEGPIEIAPGTHRMTRIDALAAVKGGQIAIQPLTLDAGDVLIRHPWALHRGTPNVTDSPRALLTVRYVRRWYADYSREVNPIPVAVWRSLTADQQQIMRFPVPGAPDRQSEIGRSRSSEQCARR